MGEGGGAWWREGRGKRWYGEGGRRGEGSSVIREVWGKGEA